jgi:hypothetical protein
MATLISNAVGLLFAAGIEVLTLMNPIVYNFMHPIGNQILWQHWLLVAIGLICFILSGFISYWLSAKSFEKVDF